MSPASTKRAISGPITGNLPACAAATITDQTAVWSQRRSCPVKASAMVSISSTAPESQLSSRGNLYAPMTKVRSAWMPISSTIADAPK